MASQLAEAVVKRNEPAIEHITSSLKHNDNWSLITIIDELLPLMLMESNLRYGSFHNVKMNLFLRKLALEGFFSKATEAELAHLIALEAARREWVSIRADRFSMKQSVSSPAENMIKALDRGNVHNAFYYANALMLEDPDLLVQTLLRLGANAIPGTLGHSLSCFFPVVQDLISVDNPQTYTALLSYIMFLSRYDADNDVLKEAYGRSEGTMDYGAFLRICASGTGIVEVHHTITFYVFTEWEHAALNKGKSVPYALLLDWVGAKELDKGREERAANSAFAEELPVTYEEFSSQFSFKKLDNSVPLAFRMMDLEPEKAVDWLFRLYASHYDHGWDPHYYTSLYSAIRLNMDDAVRDKIACRMALDQSLHYFAAGMNRQR